MESSGVSARSLRPRVLLASGLASTVSRFLPPANLKRRAVWTQHFFSPSPSHDDLESISLATIAACCSRRGKQYVFCLFHDLGYSSFARFARGHGLLVGSISEPRLLHRIVDLIMHLFLQALGLLSVAQRARGSQNPITPRRSLGEGLLLLVPVDLQSTVLTDS